MYPNNNCDDCPPCPGTITPLPLPDLSGLCGDEYNAACVIYTGPDITCLGIESGMTFLEVLAIFNNILPGCDCCEKNPVNCVVGPWSNWSECKCYYEDELPVCGRQSRTRSIITPAQDGGAACPPLIEYRPCNVSSMCFTFGSAICETEPNGTQITVPPTGIHDDKPYYSFEVCGIDQSVWWSDGDDKWHISDTVGIPRTLDCTLDNDDNYYPVSNTTTQLWNCPQDGIYLDLIQSTLNTCPTYLICFHLQLTIGGQIYNFYNSIAPYNTPFDTADHPVYLYSVSDGSASHNVSIYYYPAPTNEWTARVDGVIIGTLASTNLYPHGNWVANPANPGNFFVSAVLGGSCVQPPNVNCVLNCGPWSACVGGTRTRTCTVATPPSGNGTPCPPLLQTEVCAVPNCFPPTAVVATDTSSNIVISFTGVSGAASYQVSYSIDGGTPVLLSGVTSPITLPYSCDATYTGTIVTQCSNGLTSSPVSWGPITTAACGFCSTEPAHPMIGGGSITSPVGATVALSGDDTQYGGNLNFGTFASIQEIVLIPAGYIYAGQISTVSGPSFSTVGGFAGAVLIGCDFEPVPSFFGSGFSAPLGGGQAVIYGVVYDPATDRIYVGGTFTKYKGINCTPNFVVLRGVDGNIDTTFATNSVGAVRTAGFASVNSFAVQSDGKILVAGAFDSMYGNTTCKYVCRFLPTGVIDTSFITGASITNTTPQVNLYKVTLDSANNIFIAGSFNAYQGVTRYCIAKLSPSGAIDTTFNPGLILFNGSCTVAYIKDVQVQGSNLIIGGTISVYNGTPVHGLLRINSTTAAIDPAFNLYVPTYPIGCSRVSRILVKNNLIFIGANWTSYNISNKALYYVLDANGTPVFNTTVVITPVSNGAGTINAILVMP